MTEVTSRFTTDADTEHAPRRTRRIDVERRRVDGRDTAFLRSLFAESREGQLLLTPDTREVIIDMQFRAQRRAWRLDHPDACHEMLLVRGVRAGHVLVAEDAATIHVVDVAVRSGLQGLGIGGGVIAAITARADRTRRTVRLRVWGGDHEARRFFERHGFRSPGATAGYHDMFRAPVELVD